MSLNIIYICAGILEGIIFSILFFRMDSSWKRVISFGGGSGGLVATFIGLNTLLATDAIYKINLFAILLCTFLISAFLCFILLCILLKKQNDTNKIRTLDIIVGYDKFFINYYENRQKEIDSILNYDKLDVYRKELESKEKEIEEREKVLNENQNSFFDSLQNIPCLSLPVKSKIPIDSSFIEVLPSYVDNLAIFINDMGRITSDFLLKYDEYKDNEYNYLVGYFLAVCTYISKSLFDSNSNNVRAHVRIRNSDMYEKLVASLGGNEFKGSLTPMPINRGMIYESFKAKSSLIKSLNIGYHLEGSNDSIWQEYMTFTLNSILCTDGFPFIAIGVSVKNREKYKKLLQFLNYYKIENLIQESVNRINGKCNIIKIIENRRNLQEKEVI